jgi:hypothetical protein
MPNRFGEFGRRTFLIVAAATAASGAAARIALRPTPSPAPGAGLAGAFRHRDSAVAIGRRYLDRYPDDTQPVVLASGLQRVGTGDPAVARAALRTQVQQDFARSDTVLLDGWVLARSECRACAALALATGAAG